MRAADPVSEHGEGIEMANLEGGGGGGRPNGHGPGPQCKPYTVVDVAPSESGYETDATAFSEGGMSDDEDNDGDDGGAATAASGADSLLGRQGDAGRPVLLPARLHVPGTGPAC